MAGLTFITAAPTTRLANVDESDPAVRATMFTAVAFSIGPTFVLRRILNPMGPQDAIEFLLDKLRNSKNNADFFQSMNT